MKALNKDYAAKRVHSQLKGQPAELSIRGKYGRVELKLVNKRYRVTAINYESRQHFNKDFATLPGAIVAYDYLKEYWA